jgi:RNA polymerase sigma factor (sigma-70 family)
VPDRQANAVLGTVRRLAATQAVSRLTDPQLLERFRRDNDQDAFAALVKRHGPLVRKVCWRVLHHAEDVEDAFQATFLVLARHVGSIRRQGALGSFLHGAAYRTALRARRDAGRRRHHEREAQRMARRAPNLEVAWREIQAVLDEETAALPEKYRAVFVLCCLEGQSKPEAARHLGLKEGTVSSRLAQARKLLQQRLTRRGLTLTAVLGAVAVSENTGLAALSTSAVRATAAAAVAFRSGPPAGAAVSGRAASLAEGMGRNMFVTRYKLFVALVLALATAAGAGAVAAQRPPAAPPPAQPPAATRPETPPAAQALEESAEAVTLRGRVLGPDGKPFAGADVGVGWYRGYPLDWWPWVVPPMRPAKGGRSGPDGRFAFTLTKAEIFAAVHTVTAHPWREVQVVATAKGAGPGWAYVTPQTKDVTLRLAADVPVKGRVVDLQGAPVAGASVRLAHVTVGGNFLTVNAWPGLPAEVRTDKGGRFVFAGVGAGREVMLHVAGPAIEHKAVSVSTAAGTEGRAAGDLGEIVAGPTKPVVGTVRDKETGKPLAGVRVYGDRAKHRAAVSAVTDAEGQFRLVGLPKQSRYEVTFRPPPGRPYLEAGLHLADTEGLRPLAADSVLRRGVPVRFRLIDKETRRPVRARVQYTPTQDNPFYAEAEEQPGFVPTRAFQEVHTPDKDQYYNLTAYPGPGAILVFGWYSGRTYLPAKVSAADAGKAGVKDPIMMFLNLAVGYRIIDPARSDTALSFEIELDPGRALTGKLVGPDGEPVRGAMSSGLSYTAHDERRAPSSPARQRKALPTESFTVECLAPPTPRTIAFAHEGRKLIGHRVLNGDETGPLTVRLQPWGAATGRLVDAAGKPVTDARILLVCPSLPAPGLQPLAGVARTDAAGRYRVEGLAPGLKYELQLRRGEAKSEVLLSAGDAVKGISTKAGEVKELGDVRVTVPAARPKK